MTLSCALFIGWFYYFSPLGHDRALKARKERCYLVNQSISKYSSICRAAERWKFGIIITKNLRIDKENC